MWQLVCHGWGVKSAFKTNLLANEEGVAGPALRRIVFFERPLGPVVQGVAIIADPEKPGNSNCRWPSEMNFKPVTNPGVLIVADREI